MALNITHAEDPLEIGSQVIAVYGDPGLGKTSLGYSFAEPLLLDFDAGSARSAYRRDSVQVRSWEDVTDITPSDLAGYKTLIVDTVGRLLDCLTAAIIAENPKNGRGAGSLSLEGWGVLKTRFAGWVAGLRDMGLDLVLLSHAKEDKRGDDSCWGPDVQGSSKGELFKVADACAYYHAVGRGVRTLEFAPCDAWLAKDPAQLGSYQISDFGENARPDAGAVLMGIIRSKLESHAAASGEAQKMITEQEEAVSKIDSPEGLTDYGLGLSGLDLPRPVHAAAKKLVVNRARELGYEWSKADSCYVPPPSDAGEEAA